MFTLRFDMQAPPTGAAAGELYAAALEMAEWADSHGAFMVALSEHHATTDGYLPSPTVLASAMAARTTRLPIWLMVAILPLYDPIRLAEDMCVLDVLSGGRVMLVAGLGYRPEEYELFGVDFSARGAIAEEKLELLLRARTGEPFEHRGHTLQVTPAPVTPGGPTVAWGGGSVAAARRAGRHGIGLFAQRGTPAMREAYEEAARAAGHKPGICFLPQPDMPTTVFVSDDLDRAWDELGPYLMHDVRTYAAWNPAKDTTASMSHATTVDELRRAEASHRVLTVDEAVALMDGGGVLQMHPLIGGLPPEIAWRYLRTVSEEVLPRRGKKASS